jgi:hypothetical protein
MGSPAFLRISGVPTGTPGTSNFTVSVTDNAGTNRTAVFDLTIFTSPYTLPFTDDFSTDKGWQRTGLWERNVAQAYSATGPTRSEPGTDHSSTSDNNILGHDIGGDYANSIGTAEFAISPPIDCSGATSVRLRFWRWLGCSPNDTCKVQVTNNGTVWTDVWVAIAAGTTNDTAWTSLHYDISALAAGYAVVQVRFQLGPTDSSIVNTGWCIDDLIIEQPGVDLLFQENGSAGAQIIDDAPPAGTFRDMGTVAVGANNSITVYVTNNGPTPVTFGGGGNPPYAKTGANPGQFYMPDWNTVPNPLQPGASAPFTITFNSGTNTGSFSCTIEIYHNALFSGSSPFQINVVANAVVPQAMLRVNFGSPTGPQINHQDPPTSANGRDFGSQDVNAGPSTTITIFITNAGTGNLAITTPQMGGVWWTEYTINSTGMVSQLAPGASTSFTVAFDPNSVGQKNADVLFSHNDGTQPSPFYVQVTGLGVTGTPLPGMALEWGASSIPDGSSFNVGPFSVNATATLYFTIRNTGTAALNLTGSPIVEVSNQVDCMAVISANPVATTLAQGGTTVFSMGMTPQLLGAWSFDISVDNNDPVRDPFDVTIHGVGIVVPTGLMVTTQPIDSDAGSVLTIAPVVAITDVSGNVDTSNNTTQVEVTITTGTGDPAATLSGTTTGTAVNGLVTFADLEISHSGKGYTLTFTDLAGSLGTITSNPFDVTGGGGGGDEEEEQACSTGAGVGFGGSLGLLAAGLALLRRRRESA